MKNYWDSPDVDNVIKCLILNEDKIKAAIQKNIVRLLSTLIFNLLYIKLELNTIESSSKNISFHYDIGNDLYSKMLGKHMQYTCAYFHKPNMTLDEAQYAKMELIAKKLDLRPGMKVLDIGCGFGSMANHLASKYNVNVIGVTLSKEQKIYADKNFSNKNIDILVQDYRSVEGKFDRVYSVGMFEHVGRKNYKEYYDKCYDLLKDDGIMLIHTIITSTREWNHNRFINKHIFLISKCLSNVFIFRL